jgi:hypothetical protein
MTEVDKTLELLNAKVQSILEGLSIILTEVARLDDAAKLHKEAPPSWDPSKIN